MNIGKVDSGFAYEVLAISGLFLIKMDPGNLNMLLFSVDRTEGVDIYI